MERHIQMSSRFGNSKVNKFIFRERVTAVLIEKGWKISFRSGKVKNRKHYREWKFDMKFTTTVSTEI